MGQARAYPRHEVHIEAEILFDGDTRRLGGTILDMSEGGARVVLDEARALWGLAERAGNRLYLIETRFGIVYESELRWLRFGDLGVCFTDFTTRPRRRELIAHASRGLVHDPLAKRPRQVPVLAPVALRL